MPVHDWTKVNAGIFHHFHNGWIGFLAQALNGGRLPPGYYALTEQVASAFGPDVLALELAPLNTKGTEGNGAVRGETDSGGIALASSAPQVRFTAVCETDEYARKRDRIVIRHTSGHQVIAVIELVSPGNKISRQALRAFVDKAVAFIQQGVHLLVVDLFPPSARDPQGIHAAIWAEIEDHNFQMPTELPLTLAAYAAGLVKRAFVEPVAVGQLLPDMPLFIAPERYISVPLETTYREAFAWVPAFYRQILETPPG